MDFELPAISFLQTLSEAELQAFGALLELRSVHPAQRVVQEDQPMTHFFLVCSGVIHVRRKMEKGEVLLGRITAGGFFGEVNLFNEGTASASIYAMAPTELAAVEYRVLRAFMEANPAIGYKIVSALMQEACCRLRQTNDRLLNSLFWSGVPEEQ